MTAIARLENTICHLELPELAGATVSAHALVQTIDPSTLAVVVFCGSNTQIIEDAIRGRCHDTRGITTASDIITVII
ncbi:hypothetical protein OHB26_35140 [Nocardia sp. NBC_01503]|uniref:hypothetical protein n=1 Tax=Nocardia sp. NBC_01503 TaxID=2975997 RepID=UPI002E7AFCBF|nr:hypothetical protein [Nocardia sp. NBC_01503]WTL32075.1 hypothetical protein OHB26_35140 [Nocardia sp. NBC_01503]